MIQTEERRTLRDILDETLAPLVRAIDCEATYPGRVLRALGAAGCYPPPGAAPRERWSKSFGCIEEAAVHCGSTAFLLWCHTTAIVYCANADSAYLRTEVLPKLSTGEWLGATGLSNAMKYYAGMEPLRLKASAVAGGYRISGLLPFVSNLGPGHWFGVVAEVDEGRRIAAFLPTDVEGLEMRERKEFLGLNGTATYNCCFSDVFVPRDWLLSEDADAFVRRIRAEFVLNQAAIALGLTRAAVEQLERLKEKQEGANRYLRLQPEDLWERLGLLTEWVQRLLDEGGERGPFRDVVELRLAAAYLALDAAHAGMLHLGGPAYIRQSAAARRLREAYFLALVTPAVKQLEKLLQQGVD